MDLTQLANLGEFIGGVAVLVTLMYLALQIRQGNQAGRTEAHRAVAQEWNRVTVDPLRELEFANRVRRGFEDFGSLSGDEQLSVSAYFTSVVVNGEHVYALANEGKIEPELAKAIDQAIGAFLQVPGMAAWWSVARVTFIPQYMRHLDELIAHPDRPPPFHETVPWLVANQAWAPRS